MYMGSEGVHSHTFAYEQRADCPVCTSTVQKMSFSSQGTLTELIQNLKDGNLRLSSPSLVSGSGTTVRLNRFRVLADLLMLTEHFLSYCCLYNTKILALYAQATCSGESNKA